MSSMVNFGPLAAEICWRVCGTTTNFKGFHILAVLLRGSQLVGVSQTLLRWTEGATYIWQGGHQVGHWPTFLVSHESVLAMWLLIFFLQLLWRKPLARWALPFPQNTMQYADEHCTVAHAALCMCTAQQKCKYMSYVQYIWLSQRYDITATKATTARRCITYFAVTHKTVYNAQAGISGSRSRHLIQKKRIL